MKCVFRAFHGPSDWGWVQHHLALHRVEDTVGVIAVDEDTNTTVAGFIGDSWTATAVQGHIIIDDPMVLRHGFLEEVTDFVYNVGEREVIIATVASNNAAALSVNKKIGFSEIARIPDGMSFGVDSVIMTMTKEQCPYWTPHTQKVAANG
jgi:RimJ/RimL family protein N-acetyltransferase